MPAPLGSLALLEVLSDWTDLDAINGDSGADGNGLPWTLMLFLFKLPTLSENEMPPGS